MAIYIGIFSVSALLFALSEQLSNKNVKSICVFFAILLPVTLAGCRASSIGTDVMIYGKWDFVSAGSSDSFVQYFSTRKYALLAEPLYQLLVYTLSQIFSNYHWGLFTYNLLAVSFAYAGMKRCKKLFNTPLWLGMLLYYFSMYNTSLNLMRQSIAISIVFFAATFLLEERYKTFFLLVVLGMGFHTSALFGFAFLPIYFISAQKRNKCTWKKIFHFGILITTICVVFFASGIAVNWLVSHGIIRAVYLTYFYGGENAISRISFEAILVYGAYLVLHLLHHKYLDQRGMESLFFAAASAIILFSRFGQIVSIYFPRISLYFMPLQAVDMASIINCYRTDSRKIWAIFIVTCFFASWFAIFVYKGNAETVPYIFDVSRN